MCILNTFLSLSSLCDTFTSSLFPLRHYDPLGATLRREADRCGEAGRRCCVVRLCHRCPGVRRRCVCIVSLGMCVVCSCSCGVCMCCACAASPPPSPPFSLIHSSYTLTLSPPIPPPPPHTHTQVSEVAPGLASSPRGTCHPRSRPRRQDTEPTLILFFLLLQG